MEEQENNMEMVQFEFPDEEGGDVKETPIEETEEYKKAYEEAYKREMAKYESSDASEDDFEEVDDTPEEDRGRAPLPDDVVEELENDELNDYSDRVRMRMSQLKKVWHDERRAKEATQREREEALRIAQRIVEENKRLKATLSSGEEILMQTMKEAAEREFEIAKREYKEAYDAGDTEKVVEAQQRLTSAQYKLHQTAGYRPQYNFQQTALQQNENIVDSIQERPQVPQPDQKAVAWQKRNTWFGTDEEMTSLALGLHEKLVKNGVDPRSDEYYKRIDGTMRKRFPEYFGSTQASPRAKAAPVVAPATRSTAPKKVVLTKTQVNLAKKLGITPEQYARELIKENANG